MLEVESGNHDCQRKILCSCVDEMAIKQAIEYSRAKELIEGFEDLGELGRKPMLAKQVLVFLVRGIYGTWKIPMSYFFV